jgi:hypothetical protein
MALDQGKWDTNLMTDFMGVVWAHCDRRICQMTPLVHTTKAAITLDVKREPDRFFMIFHGLCRMMPVPEIQ